MLFYALNFIFSCERNQKHGQNSLDVYLNVAFIKTLSQK